MRIEMRHGEQLRPVIALLEMPHKHITLRKDG